MECQHITRNEVLLTESYLHICGVRITEPLGEALWIWLVSINRWLGVEKKCDQVLWCLGETQGEASDANTLGNLEQSGVPRDHSHLWEPARLVSTGGVLQAGLQTRASRHVTSMHLGFIHSPRISGVPDSITLLLSYTPSPRNDILLDKEYIYCVQLDTTLHF